MEKKVKKLNFWVLDSGTILGGSVSPSIYVCPPYIVCLSDYPSVWCLAEQQRIHTKRDRK